MASAPPIGSVDVEVGANLDKLLAGFRDAERAAGKLDTALTKQVAAPAARAERAAGASAAAVDRLATALSQTSRASADFSLAVNRAESSTQKATKGMAAMNFATAALGGVAGGLIGTVGTLGAVALEQLIKKLFDTTTEAKKAADTLAKIDTVSSALELSQASLGKMFDLQTGKLKVTNDELRVNLALLSAKALAEGRLLQETGAAGLSALRKPGYNELISGDPEAGFLSQKTPVRRVISGISEKSSAAQIIAAIEGLRALPARDQVNYRQEAAEALKALTELLQGTQKIAAGQGYDALSQAEKAARGRGRAFTLPGTYLDAPKDRPAPKGRGGRDGSTFRAADADAALTGIGARVGSKATRSYATQKRLYDKYMAYKAGTGPWAALAAKPGTSAHEFGRARDISKTPGMSLEKIRDAIEGAGGRITELLDEGSHFHVAWAATSKDVAKAQDARLNADEEFNASLAQINEQIAESRRSQLVDEKAIEEAERARLREAAASDNQKTRANSDLTKVQAEALTKARNELLASELAAVDMRERQRLESEATRMAEAAHETQIDALQAQEEIASTASERRKIERQILAAQKAYERAVLEAIIASPSTKPIDRDLARSKLAGLDKRFEGREGQINERARGDLRNTAPRGSRTDRENQIEDIRTQQANDLAIIQEHLDARLLSEEEAARRRVEIETEASERIGEIKNAERDLQIEAARSTAESLLSILEDTAGKQSGIYKAMFIVTKAFAIAESIIKIQQALASATASLPFPANLPVIAAVAAQGAAIISNISSIGAQFREGGYTGDGPEGRFAGMVHGKEFVAHAAATRKFRPMLEDMNAGRDPTARFRNAASEAGPGGMMGGGASGLKVEMKNYAPNVVHSVEQVDYGLVRIIARDEAPRAVASDMNKSNSMTRKALNRNTTARTRKN